MRGRAVRRVPERSMEVEAVVSYSLIPPEGAKPASGDNDGRVEPRLTILPMERKVRSAEIAAPSFEEAAEHGARFEARPIDPLPPEPRAGRRRVPAVAIVGLAALLVGFGVLAATFGKVMTGNAPAVTQPASDEPSSVVLAPPPSPSEETAGPGVRVIPADGATGAPTDPVATDAVAIPPSTNAAALAPAPAPSVAPLDPPLPRLRPTTPSIASLSQSDAALPQPAAPAATSPAQGDDVGAMMSDIDRILAQHKAETAEPAPLAPAATTADAGLPAATGPVPLQAMTSPPPARRGWFLYPDRDTSGMPVPPADIPDPEGAPGQ